MWNVGARKASSQYDLWSFPQDERQRAVAVESYSSFLVKNPKKASEYCTLHLHFVPLFAILSIDY